MSPQFHVVFDDNFTTVPYMNSGEIPPNWETLVQNNSHLSTENDFKLAQEWNNKEMINKTFEETMQISEGEYNTNESNKRKHVSFEDTSSDL